MITTHIIGTTLPECWEKSVLACWSFGASFPTQYDKPEDKNSKDIMLLMHIKNPMAEPRIHRAFPGGLDDLEKYRSEVLYGVHDHWVNPQEGKWEYTYHQRLFEYQLPGVGAPNEYNDPDAPYEPINQIEECIKLLQKCGHTRRAQAITWKPWEDLGIHDPACLQRFWFRIEDNKLNMVANMRSNDAYKAAYMNIYAFTELQQYMANRLGVEVGEYIHCVDSFHIYGSYFSEFEGFLSTVNERSFDNRVWRSDDTSIVIPSFIEGCDTLLAEDMPECKKALVLSRKEELLTKMNIKEGTNG